jgi:hypothetical protein
MNGWIVLHVNETADPERVGLRANETADLKGSAYDMGDAM